MPKTKLPHWPSNDEIADQIIKDLNLATEPARGSEEYCAPLTGSLAQRRCMKCGKLFDPYWSKRFRKTAKCCATCAWKNLEAFVAQPDPESEKPENAMLNHGER